MHTNTPQTFATFRGNKKWSYVDNSGQILGQPDVNCVMLNTSAPPFNNHTLRVAMAKASNAARYAKIIDLGINAPMSDCSSRVARTTPRPPIPSLRPQGREETGQAGSEADRSAGGLHPHRHQRLPTSSGRPSSSSRNGAKPG
jgi:ABC-type transport system substrate-binding protein